MLYKLFRLHSTRKGKLHVTTDVRVIVSKFPLPIIMYALPYFVMKALRTVERYPFCHLLQIIV